MWASHCGGFFCGARFQRARLSSCVSVVLVHELCCSMACGIFLDQDLNPYLWQWQVDSLPLSHQGSPMSIYFLIYFFLQGTSLSPTHFVSLSSIPAAAAAAKSLQSCQTLCDPMDGSQPGSPVPGILQARTLERVAISFSNA